MANRSFIIGRGEVLTREVTSPSRRLSDKAYPYSFDESLAFLKPRLVASAQALDLLPGEACPGDLAVEAITLNPAFIAKSYFPSTLLEATGLRSIGSRSVSVLPKKWTRKEAPKQCSTTQLFVAGTRKTFRSLAAISSSLPMDSEEAFDLRKIEDVGLHHPLSSSCENLTDNEESYFEVGLHLLKESPYPDIMAAFLEYANQLGIKTYETLSFRAGNLWFLPILGSLNAVRTLGQFAFLRIVRPMPGMRGLPSPARSSGGLVKIGLPRVPPLAMDIRAAILDGGLPDEHLAKPWLGSYIKLDDRADDVESYNAHGLGVTSAFLFGPLRPGDPVPQPYCPVTHLRVLDKKTEEDDPLQLYRTLGLVEQVLLSREYQFLNLSLGPDLPIDDSDVHAWTSVIDDLLSDGETLLTVAAGNNGERDALLGLNRIQVPADCVNALSVGAADSDSSASWQRAPYSAIGPGRSPGVIKPDLVAFGGSPKEYFHVLAPGNESLLAPSLGTSFASPYALRTAVGIRAYLGDHIGMNAIKALLIHTSQPGSEDHKEIGWGRILNDIGAVISCPDGEARIVFQGELRPGKVLRAPLPMPKEEIEGFIEVRATFCYTCSTDPQDSGLYTRAGLDVTFRPNAGKKGEGAKEAKSRSFFSRKEYSTESELRSDSGKWETVLHGSDRFQSSTLFEPVFDIHYNARQAGRQISGADKIRYALIVSIVAPKMVDISSRILNRFPALVSIQPRIVVPVHTER